MKYRFPLESVLKHRQRLEDAAQREFLEAQGAVNAILREIEAMYVRFDEVREEIAVAQQSGIAGHIAMVQQMEEFLRGFNVRIDQKRLEARHLLTIAEEKQEILMFAAREKKILVKLKEKRKGEHMEWIKQNEVKEQDDMTTMRRGRR